MTASHDEIDTRIPGVALVAGAILAVAAMAHHPTGGGAATSPHSREASTG